MDEINWVTMLVALGLGVVVGLLFLAAGMWMDRARERRFMRELNLSQAPQGFIDGIRNARLPEQRDGGHDADGA